MKRKELEMKERELIMKEVLFNRQQKQEKERERAEQDFRDKNFGGMHWNAYSRQQRHVADLLQQQQQ